MASRTDIVAVSCSRSVVGEAGSTHASVKRLLAPVDADAPSALMGNTQLEDGVPTSRRLREVLRRHDVSGERAIALAQGAIARCSS